MTNKKRDNPILVFSIKLVIKHFVALFHMANQNTMIYLGKNLYLGLYQYELQYRLSIRNYWVRNNKEKSLQLIFFGLKGIKF